MGLISRHLSLQRQLRAVRSLAFWMPAAADAQLLNIAAGPGFLSTFAYRYTIQVDLSIFTQARLQAYIGTVAGNAGSHLQCFYVPTFATSFTTWRNLGVSELAIPVDGGTTSHAVSEWIEIPKAARAAVYVALGVYGGDVATDPQLGNVTLQFR